MSLAAVLLFGPLLYSQTPSEDSENQLKRMTLEQLGQIQVTTMTKEPEMAFSTPAALFVVTNNDIRRSGARTLPDVLRMVPGIEVMQIDASKFAVGIRGFAGRLSKSVLVLIDGRSVYTPLFAGVYWEMQDTLLEDIDRIEVVRGPGGTIWGPNVVNGVINIITKSARDTHGTMVSAGGGNVEQGFANVRYGDQHGNFHYRLWGKMFNRGPQFHSDGRNFDDWRRTQAGFRSDWDANDRDSFTLQADAYESTVGTKLGVSYFSPPRFTNVEGNGYFYGVNLLGRWQRKLNDRSNLQLQVYYDRSDRRDINAREIRDTFDFDFIHRFQVNRHQITWGVGERVSPSEFIQTVPSVDFLPHQQTYNLFSGFVQDEITIVPGRFSVTVGSKLEHNTFSGFDAQPSGRFLWTPSRKTSAWGSVTRANRTPSRIEDNFNFNALAVPSLPLYIRLIGDGHFEPENVNSYELGVRRMFTPRLAGSIATFFNQYDNLLSVDSRATFAEVTPAPTHLVLPLFLRNGVRGNTRGIETVGVWDATDSLRLQGTYSFVHLSMRNKPSSNDASTVKQLQGDTPEHKFTAQASLDLGKAVQLDAGLRYVSAIRDFKVPAYTTADLRVAWRVGQFELSVAGRNLLQPRHFEYGGDPGPLVAIRRSVLGMIEWRH